MKKTILILLSVLFLNQQVLAVTLFEALTEAYKNNTDLNAERENINISEEDLKISKGNYLPTVTISGSKSQEDTSKLTNRSGVEQSVNDVDPSTQSIKIEQTLIDFGRNADVQKNQIGIRLAVVKLLKKEQEVLLKAIEAYSGLVLANKKLKIKSNSPNLFLIFSARFKYRLAEALGCPASDVEGMVIGGHSDTGMVPLIEKATRNSVNVAEFLAADKMDEIVEATKVGGATLTGLLGTSAWYAPGAAAAQMVESIVKDENRIFPVCVRLTGQYGLKNMYLGAPVQLGKNGITKIIELKLNASEKKLLHKSADAVKAVMATFTKMKINIK